MFCHRHLVPSRHGRGGVQSRRIGYELGRGPVIEAFESGSIIAVNEVMEEGVALGVGMELVLALVLGDGGAGGDGFGDGGG